MFWFGVLTTNESNRNANIATCAEGAVRYRGVSEGLRGAGSSTCLPRGKARFADVASRKRLAEDRARHHAANTYFAGRALVFSYSARIPSGSSLKASRQPVQQT